jgi:phenylpropionate dioxygenase-like ring-hydroxylating dioxygenase large terminal subunit
MAKQASLLLKEPNRIPAGRYFDEEFFALESEKVWKHAWQPACHLDEIPNVGDFREYRVLEQSYLIVRESATSVKAFRNACRHRGTALGTGSGSFANQQITCPFHGWRYNLDGSISYVYGASYFPRNCTSRDELALRDIRVGVRYGFVWINPDPNGGAFEDAFHGIEKALDPLRLDLMHMEWWHRVEMKGNWKIAQEAFFESFHQMQTHPEVVKFKRDADVNFELQANYATDPQGHGWLSDANRGDQPDSSFMEYVKGMSPAEFMVNTQRVMWEGARSIVTQWQFDIANDLLKRGVSNEEFLPVYMKEVYAEAERRKVPLPQPTLEATSHGTVFPNFTLVAGQGTALIYRSRPLTANSCEYDIFSLAIRSEGEVIPRAFEGMGAPWKEHWFVHQDVSNIERQQIGLRTDGYGSTRLSPGLEALICNWHMALDGRLTETKKLLREA